MMIIVIVIFMIIVIVMFMMIVIIGDIDDCDDNDCDCDDVYDNFEMICTSYNHMSCIGAFVILIIFVHFAF